MIKLISTVSLFLGLISCSGDSDQNYILLCDIKILDSPEFNLYQPNDKQKAVFDFFQDELFATDFLEMLNRQHPFIECTDFAISHDNTVLIAAVTQNGNINISMKHEQILLESISTVFNSWRDLAELELVELHSNIKTGKKGKYIHVQAKLIYLSNMTHLNSYLFNTINGSVSINVYSKKDESYRNLILEI